MNHKYKQTELGLIPSDWEVKRLGDIGFFKKGKGIRKDEVFPDGLPCIRYGELYTRHNEYVKKINSFISQNVAKESQRIAKGDILFAGSGETREEIGKCAAFLSDKETYAGGDIVILSPKNCDSLFLGFLLNDSIIAKQKAQNGQGDAVVHIYPNGLSRILLPIPPTLAEQTAIATALSDADGLITSLEKLIAKKRNIKQGAMQELLRPKEGWVVKRLGEVCTLSKSKINPITSDKNYKCIELEHLSQGSGQLLDYANSQDLLSQKSLFAKGDILFGKLRPYLRKFLLADFDGVCTTEIWVLKPGNGVLNKFLYQLVQSEKIVDAANLSTGTKMPRAEWKTVSETTIYLPLTSEQNQIATILSDMDSELLILEKKLEKAKQIKQGMMQQLLTGKIRLV